MKRLVEHLKVTGANLSKAGKVRRDGLASEFSWRLTIDWLKVLERDSGN